MANVKITELSSATTLGSSDVFPVVDVGSTVTKKVTVTDLLRNTPDGSASAPSIANAGDQDTGIYFPAENNVGVSTGGTQRLVIDSSGNVGINVTSPTRKFQVAGSGTSIISNIARTDGTSCLLTFSDNATSSDAAVGIGAFGNNMLLRSGSAERMRIDSSGNLLLGTSSSSSQSGTFGQSIRGSNPGLTFIGTESSGQIRTLFESAGNLIFWNGNSAAEIARFDSNGRLGLGTSSPSSKLSVESLNSNTTPFIESLGTINGSQGSIFLRGGSAAGYYYDFKRNGTNGNLEIQGNQTSFNNICLAPTSGKVGIGTSAPETLLHLRDTSASARLSIQGGSNAASIINLGDQNDIDVGKILYNHASNHLAFTTAAAERLRVDSSGRLLLGTTTEGEAAADNLTIADSGSCGITIRSGTSNNGNIFFSDTTSGTGEFDGFIQYQQNNRALRFATATAERLRIDSSGNVGINETSIDRRLHVRNDGAAAAKFGGEGGGGDYAIEIGQLSATSSPGFNATGGSSMLFQMGGTEAMRIDSSGRLLVGKTATGTNNARLQSASATGPQIVAQNTGTGAAFALFVNSTTGDAASGDGLYVGLDANKGYVWNYENNDLLFGTDSTERMKITSAGRKEFYNDSGNSSLHIRSSSTSGTADALIVGAYGATAGSVGSGTNSFVVYTNGNVANTNNSYGAISDAKLKENIVDASSQWSDLKSIQVRNYNFIEGQTHTQLGVVAQEVEAVSPGLVTESPDLDDEGNDLGTTTKSVNYSVLYMKAVKALQEAMDRIETLEAKVAALEAQ